MSLGAAALIIRLMAAVPCCACTMAFAADQLYRAQTIVTGQGEANRIVDQFDRLGREQQQDVVNFLRAL